MCHYNSSVEFHPGAIVKVNEISITIQDSFDRVLLLFSFIIFILKLSTRLRLINALYLHSGMKNIRISQSFGIFINVIHCRKLIYDVGLALKEILVESEKIYPDEGISKVI